MDQTSERAHVMGANCNNSYGNDNGDDLNDLRRWRRRRQVAAHGQATAAFEHWPVGQQDNGHDREDQNNGQDQNPPPGTRKTSHMVSGGSSSSSKWMAIISLWQQSTQRRPIHHHLGSSSSSRCHHQSKASLFLVTVLLPFILVFLLPSARITERKMVHLDDLATRHGLDSLLLSLLRLPLDRFRLTSGYSMMLLANAKEINHRQQQQQHHHHHQTVVGGRQASNDLQEEETHLLMMAPEQQAQRGYQLAPPNRQAPSYGGPEQDSYGHDYAVSGGANHANLVGTSGEAAAGEADSTVAAELMPASASGSVVAPSAGQTTAVQRPDLPSVRALNVKCEKNHMTVNIVFDRPFYGMVFSKGHYNDQKCVHLPPNSGQTSINFDIHLGKCGMSSSSDSGGSAAGTNANTNGQALQQTAASATGQQQQPNGLFIENTIIIQYDPQVQEIYDQARRLRCTWYDYYEKSVSFRPYNVDMLDAVTANFLGDNIQCWMQIQVGKGPWSSEVAGIVKIGQTMTMVLAIKDDENKFDMLVRNCVASDGKHQPIQLVDEYGCVARPKIMAKFQKVRNFGPAATVVSYAHFQAFKFPDSMSVHFQCVIQVCRYECPEPVCSSASSGDQIGGAGPSSSSGSAGGGAGTVQDYAASGTELISSKEPMPSMMGRTGGHQNVSHLLQGSGSGINSVNLKLDESQGRVQVKLDTSMMANTGGGPRTGGGALPPHLLHAGQQEQGGGRATGHTYLSSSYYRPTLGSATAPAQLAPASAGSSRPLSSAATGQMRPSAPLATLPGGQQQYSSPALATSSALLPPPPSHQPRPAYMMTNRMGELVAEDGLISAGPTIEDDPMAKLSLIASPRALPYGMPTMANHRYRRSINATTAAVGGHWRDDASKAKRQTVAPDSTAIKTQRTIQVVSPDDVAFNLIDLEPTLSGWPEPTPAEWNHRRRGNKGQWAPEPTVVCFSAARLILSALASLGLLVTLVVAAVVIIARQRKRLNDKLSPLYDASSACSPDLIINSQSLASHHLQQQQQHQQRQCAAEQMLLRRQQAELQQRNTYLGRLYSQFVPAAYWKQ